MTIFSNTSICDTIFSVLISWQDGQRLVYSFSGSESHALNLLFFAARFLLIKLDFTRKVVCVDFGWKIKLY